MTETQNLAADEPFPSIGSLDRRHPGVSVGLALAYEEAVSWCLSHYHQPPTTMVVTGEGSGSRSYRYEWIPPTENLRRAWNNKIDAVEAAAYGVVIAAAECYLGLMAVGRLKTGTGADYVMMPAGSSVANPADGELDYEEGIRLEVSGILDCTRESQLNDRLEAKLRELTAGKSPLDGIAGVAGFRMRRVAFQRLE